MDSGGYYVYLAIIYCRSSKTFKMLIKVANVSSTQNDF